MRRNISNASDTDTPSFSAKSIDVAPTVDER